MAQRPAAAGRHCLIAHGIAPKALASDLGTDPNAFHKNIVDTRRICASGQWREATLAD
ncbi:hypothetical protein [Streptomyces chartreusis]|uniref:hypothetical protein n=1 Tax=Streptomyces chartreusis TaxID=1969 RepID=UPI002E18BA3E